MEIDWPAVTSALGVIGGFAIATIRDVVTRYLGRKDKELDRQIAREDSHQAELRAAYAEFVAAYSRYLSVGGVMVAVLSAYENLQREGYAKAIAAGLNEEQAKQASEAYVNKELFTKIRKTVDDFETAGIEAEKRLVTVLLLENDRDLSQAAHAIFEDNLKPPQSEGDYDRFSNDIRARMRRMEALMRSLSGRFAPRPSATRPPIAGVDKQALTSGEK